MSNLPNLRARLLSNTGNVLNGGKLYFYVETTTTPKDVFTAADLVTAHSQPVTADSAGMFPEIYMTPSEPYRVILKDSSNNTIFDVDSIYATQLTGDETAFQTQVYGAFDNPMRYGADGTGAVDDTTAVQDAIDAAASVVDLLGKTYRIDGGLTLKSGLTLRNGTLDFSQCDLDEFIVGQGTVAAGNALTAQLNLGDATVQIASTASYAVDSMVFIYDSAGDPKGEINTIGSVTNGTTMELAAVADDDYTLADTATIYKVTPLTNIVLADLEIIGNTGAAGDGVPLVLRRCRDCSLVRVNITDSKGNGLAVYQSLGVRIDGCTVKNDTIVAASSGIEFGDGTSSSMLSDTLVFGFANGIKVGDAGPSSPGGICRDIVVRDCDVRLFAAGIQTTEYARRVAVSGCTAIGNGVDSLHGIMANAPDSTYSDCQIDGVATDGILLSAGIGNIAIHHNVITSAGIGISSTTNAQTGCTITGNNIYSEDECINVAVGMDYSTVTGNTMQTNSANYCAVFTGAADTVESGNVFLGYATGKSSGLGKANHWFAARITSDQAIAGTGDTDVVFNSAVSQSKCSLATGTGIVTVTNGGLYHVSASVDMSVGGALNYNRIGFAVNGATVTTQAYTHEAQGADTFKSAMTANAILSLADGDTVRVVVSPDTGGTTITKGVDLTWFRGVRIGTAT